MHRRRWLIVGLCFCVFCGCVSCQSHYDYCGPMPDEGGDFMYRKNSILGGDPSMPQSDGATKPAGETNETGPEPTPAPPPDEEPLPGMNDEGRSQSYESDLSDEEMPDEEGSDVELTSDESAEGDSDENEKQPISTLQWHAPTGKPSSSSVKQVRFR
ncbi:MAG TPA: hypothetical protein VHC22_09735 [Pirellulales bacterium]|nr:hypothetical protein [Pirellulales bacterium]